MLSAKNALHIFLSVNLVSWALLLAIRLIAFFGFHNDEVFDTYFYAKGLLLNVFLLVVFFYYNVNTEKIKELNFIVLLSKLFFTGVVCVGFSVILQVILHFVEAPEVSTVTSHFINFLYHLNIILVMIFLHQSFFYWKKMVAFQQGHYIIQVWDLYEYLLLASLLFNFFEFELRHIPFTFSCILLITLSLFMSIHLKWIAYLSAKEKWQSIVFLLFIGVFSSYFFYTVIAHSDIKHFTTDLMHSVYVLSMFSFVFFYGGFSLLVILFNLPTSSVFERKIEEIVSFQNLTKSLELGEKEDYIYKTLFENAIKSTQAQAGWLEIRENVTNVPHVQNIHNLEDETVEIFRKHIRTNRRRNIVQNTFNTQNEPSVLSSWGYHSILYAPLNSNQKSLGYLVLLKNTPNGFDEDKKEVIRTFAKQASISIDNFRLLEQTIEAERYKSELHIAQRIQESLLPKKLNVSPKYQIEAYSSSASEVGGDYYDVYHVAQKLVILMADVSGKGTNAAFHMAQMKGIFQVLAQMNFTAEEFFDYANIALANCLEKSSFITATLVTIDTETHQVEIARAGHCPTLYYTPSEQKVRFLTEGGMGLGIVRKKKYSQFMGKQTFVYGKHHLMVLYTDGVSDARNELGEDFGEDRLKRLIEAYAYLPLPELLQLIKKTVQDFQKNTKVFDDHSVLLIKRIA